MQPQGTTAVGGDCVDDPDGLTGTDGNVVPGDEIYPGHADPPYDDVDQDCDGAP